MLLCQFLISHLQLFIINPHANINYALPSTQFIEKAVAVPLVLKFDEALNSFLHFEIRILHLVTS